MKKKDEQLYWTSSDLTFDKTKLHDLALSLLECKQPSPSYPMFLWERYYLFQFRAVCENRFYMGSLTRTFLEIFRSYDFDDQNLLCELFLHNMMCEHVRTRMMASVISFMGDLQLWAFLLFMRNQIEWQLAKKKIKTNEEKIAMWVRVEPGMAYKLCARVQTVPEKSRN